MKERFREYDARGWGKWTHGCVMVMVVVWMETGCQVLVHVALVLCQYMRLLLLSVKPVRKRMCRGRAGP